MMGDFFWDTATSYPVLGALAALAIATFLVAHVPAIAERLFPAIVPYTRAAALVQVLAASLLFFLIGFRIADERAETKQLKNELAWSDNQLQQQKATAEDAERIAGEKAAEAESLKAKVEDYEATLAKQPVGTCALDDVDLDGLRSFRPPGKHQRSNPPRLRGPGRIRAAP